MQTGEVLELVKKIRHEYFPNQLRVGNCIDVCILVGLILQEEYSKQVRFTHGQLGDCLHTWMEVDGVGIDPSTDCTDVDDGRPFVTLSDTDEYTVLQTEDFDVNHYFPAISLDALKQALRSA